MNLLIDMRCLIFFTGPSPLRWSLIAIILSGWVLAASASSPSSLTDTLGRPAIKIAEGFKDCSVLAVISSKELFFVESKNGILWYLNLSETNKPKQHSLFYGSNLPLGIALAGENRVAVITGDPGQWYLADLDFEPVRSLLVPGWARSDSGVKAGDVASNPVGEIFVLDEAGRRVHHFDANGVYLDFVDLQELYQPVALEYAEESLFVADAATGKVHVFTETGSELAIIGSFPDLKRVRVVDRQISILSGQVVHEFDIFGSYTGSWTVSVVPDVFGDLVPVSGGWVIMTGKALYLVPAEYQDPGDS